MLTNIVWSIAGKQYQIILKYVWINSEAIFKFWSIYVVI